MSFLGRCTLKARHALHFSSSPTPRFTSGWPHCGTKHFSFPPPSSSKFIHTTALRRTAIYTYPIGPKPPLRRLDREARAHIFDTLLHLLRGGSGREYGLDVRPDGYLSVRQLLNYPLFRAMDLLELQTLIESDRKYRFEISFDPLKGEEAWWIRAKFWDERKYSLLPCRLIHGVRTAVYKTTLDEWNGHISHSGIPLQGGEYIQIDRTPRTPSYIDNLNPESNVFIFLDIQECILSGLRFSYLVETSSHITPYTPLVTRGNHLNLIPPTLFTSVQLVEANKTLLWGVAPEELSGLQNANGNRWPVEPLDLDEHGRRKTMLPLLSRGLHGFYGVHGFYVDFLDDDVKRGVSAGVSEPMVEEARKVLKEAEEVETASSLCNEPNQGSVPSFKSLNPPVPNASPSSSSPSSLPSQGQLSSPQQQKPLVALRTTISDDMFDPDSGLLKPWHPNPSPNLPFTIQPKTEAPSHPRRTYERAGTQDVHVSKSGTIKTEDGIEKRKKKVKNMRSRKVWETPLLGPTYFRNHVPLGTVGSGSTV